MAQAADAPRPSATPLWNAYPLSSSKPAAATTAPASAAPSGTPPARQLVAPARAPALGRTDPSGPPLAVTIAFFASLAVIALLVAIVGVRQALLRRARTRPMTCEISWMPADEGGAFRATTWRSGEEPHLVAASRRFEHRVPGPPDDEDWASRQAYAELVRELVSDGWEPVERGSAWWEMRLRRSVGTTTGAIHG